jgi:hypothetical protein
VPPTAPVFADFAAAPPANIARSTTAIDTVESHSFLFKECSFHFTGGDAHRGHHQLRRKGAEVVNLVYDFLTCLTIGRRRRKKGRVAAALRFFPVTPESALGHFAEVGRRRIGRG